MEPSLYSVKCAVGRSSVELFVNNYIKMIHLAQMEQQLLPVIVGTGHQSIKEIKVY